MTSEIYKIANTRNGKAYIGSAVDVDNRISSHLSLLRAGKHKNTYLQSAWRKYGEGRFTFAVVEIVSDIARLTEREQFWIDATRSVAPHGYNLAPRAGSSLGVVHSADYCRRMGERKRGNQYRLGMKHSDETKKKIGERSRGRVMSPESLAKRSASMMGKKNALGTKQSIEANARRSEALRTYYASPERRALQRAKWLLKNVSAQARAA